MEIELEAQNIIPQELGYVGWEETADANSFTEALEILKSNETGKREFRLVGPFKLNEEEKNSLRLLPEAFSLKRSMQKLRFDNLAVDDILIAKAWRAGLRKDNVTSIVFATCKKVSNRRLMETMCEGFKERSTDFQLELKWCSSEFVKPILEASYLRCFSLKLFDMDCTTIGGTVKNVISKGSLYYITLDSVKGLKEDVFLLLGRCLIPNLTQLGLWQTKVPVSALKRLIGSLKKILDSGRSNVIERLDLGSQVLDSRLSFACVQLLGSDLIGDFKLTVKRDISRAVVKSISSTVAKTKNLKYLNTGNKFSSGTKFNNFKLQKESMYFGSPYGVNSTVA